MYVNPAFTTSDDDAWHYVVERGFGAVVAIDADVPVASQVPLLVTGEGPTRSVEFHVARVNRLHEIIAASPRVLIVVSGPDAYISPDWYASPDQVPTWNYLAAHITGRAEALAPEAALDHVEAMSQAFERRLAPKKPWSTTKMAPARRDAMLRAIVPIRVTVEAIEASTKLSQNKSPADRAAAAGHMDQRHAWNEIGLTAALHANLARS